jgi:hypothetical protein
MARSVSEVIWESDPERASLLAVQPPVARVATVAMLLSQSAVWELNGLALLA